MAKKKGTKAYLPVGRKLESSSVSHESVAHAQGRGTLACPQKPTDTRRQQVKSVSMNSFLGLPVRDTGSWVIVSILSCPGFPLI